jgi:GH24 family phage-related lysozyme (muramidase)
MVVKEGFTEFATPDYGHYRLGYGTRSLLLSVGANGKPNTRPAIKGDKTTQKDALIVLKYEIPITYKKAVVGNNSYKISEEDWNALNKYQRTALISYAYNCGSLNTRIVNAIKAKDYAKAADFIQNGPVTGIGKPLELLNGLVRRRAEEAALFRYKP